ncbi:type IV pilus assembly protein PilM [Nocardioides dongkuii]|uniref:type IV pilus assembly protein PilM n=1 Tax=Nocardioides dongkuii TaxID=2760089 RepID=UPI0015F7AC75|nr:type IV pilus assembly protein PilM [Nocardioides dongkuii]
MARTVVGLEIGSTSVRAVEVRHGSRRPTLLRQGRVQLPVGAVEAGLVRDPAAVSAALRELWATEGFSRREVRLGVGSASVLVRQLDLEWMPEEDLRRSLRYQVADLLPVPVDDANLDLVALGDREVTDDQGITSRVARILLIATARDAVDGLVRCVQAAKLRPVRADLSAFAAVRAAAGVPGRSSMPDGTPAPEAVVDIGSQTITVTVHTAGRPEFVRVAPGNGGEMITRSLVEQIGASHAAAEEIKRTPGALPGVGGVPRSHEEAVLLESTHRLIGEIRTTLQFHATGESTAPTRVVLTGGGAGLPGLTEHCEAALRMPVHPLDDERLASPELAVAYGLCLGAAA